MTAVSALVLEHVRNPRNAGRLEGPGVLVGQAGGGEGIDRVVLYLRTAGDRVGELRFRASGCPALIAASSLLTERATGLSRSEAAQIDALSLAKTLALPEHQHPKAGLVIEAFVEACSKWDDGLA